MVCPRAECPLAALLRPSLAAGGGDARYVHPRPGEQLGRLLARDGVLLCDLGEGHAAPVILDNLGDVDAGGSHRTNLSSPPWACTCARRVSTLPRVLSQRFGSAGSAAAYARAMQKKLRLIHAQETPLDE